MGDGGGEKALLPCATTAEASRSTEKHMGCRDSNAFLLNPRGGGAVGFPFYLGAPHVRKAEC